MKEANFSFTIKMYEELGTQVTTSNLHDNPIITNTNISTTTCPFLNTHVNACNSTTVPVGDNELVWSDSTPSSIGSPLNMQLSSDGFQNYQTGYNTYSQMQHNMENFEYSSSGSSLIHPNKYERYLYLELLFIFTVTDYL